MISKRIQLLNLVEPSIYHFMVSLTFILQLKVREYIPYGMKITLNVLFSQGKWKLHFHFEISIKF
jgi:hypothetical protein